jgi:phosphonate transport system permease protein
MSTEAAPAERDPNGPAPAGREPYGLAPAIRRTLFDGFLFAYVAIFFVVAIARPGEDRLMRMGENARLFFGLWAIGAAVAAALARSGTRTLGHNVFAPPHRRFSGEAPKPWYVTFYGAQALAALGATFALGIAIVDVNILRLVDPDAFPAAMNLFAALARPDWSILPKAILKIIETIYIAFMATIFATPVAFVLSFLAARNIMANGNGEEGSRLGYGIYMLMRAGFNAFRAIEPILWAIIFSVWVGFGAFAGMLALMIHSVASLAKQYSEIVETVSEGPIEGIRSTGATRLQAIWFAVVPQVTMPFISYTIDRWDINVRMATIIGFVGGGGIGVMLLEYQGQARWQQVGCIVVVIAFVVWVMDALSAHIRNALK